jgi:hypothetical protein
MSHKGEKIVLNADELIKTRPATNADLGIPEKPVAPHYSEKAPYADKHAHQKSGHHVDQPRDHGSDASKPSKG